MLKWPGTRAMNGQPVPKSFRVAEWRDGGPRRNPSDGQHRARPRPLQLNS